jgi:hypothetical protein
LQSKQYPNETAYWYLQKLRNEIERVKNIAYEPVLATGLTNGQILDEAARRKANIALQYEDYSIETWTVATKLLSHRKVYLFDDGSKTSDLRNTDMSHLNNTIFV